VIYTHVFENLGIEDRTVFLPLKELEHFNELANNRQDTSDQAHGPSPILRQKHTTGSEYAHNAESSEYSSVMT
jgi:hypothetical protein